MKNKENFACLCAELGVATSENEIRQFYEYKELLISWNKRINLTAITDEREVVVKHFADSLTLLPYIPEKCSVIDVGTGAGFPGLPLKIRKGGVSLTLLDSLNKRVHFLERVVDKLALLDVRVIHERAENAGRNVNYRESYDVAVSRAVAPLCILAEYCLPFVNVGGVFLAMKSGKSFAEIEEAKYAFHELGGELKRVELFELEGSSRAIIEIEKVRSSPEIFPRKAGMPAKRPLTVEKCN